MPISVYRAQLMRAAPAAHASGRRAQSICVSQLTTIVAQIGAPRSLCFVLPLRREMQIARRNCAQSTGTGEPDCLSASNSRVRSTSLPCNPQRGTVPTQRTCINALVCIRTAPERSPAPRGDSNQRSLAAGDSPESLMGAAPYQAGEPGSAGGTI